MAVFAVCCSLFAFRASLVSFFYSRVRASVGCSIAHRARAVSAFRLYAHRKARFEQEAGFAALIVSQAIYRFSCNSLRFCAPGIFSIAAPNDGQREKSRCARRVRRPAGESVDAIAVEHRLRVFSSVAARSVFLPNPFSCWADVASACGIHSALASRQLYLGK